MGCNTGSRAVLAETSRPRLVPHLFAIDRRLQLHNLVFMIYAPLLHNRMQVDVHVSTW